MFLVAPRANGVYTKEFTHFRIYARGASNGVKARARFSTMNPRRVGRFQLFDDPTAEFSIDCVNTIKEADSNTKNEVQFLWTAPETRSGCVAISALVYEKSQAWHIDAGQLTQILCEGDPAVLAGMSRECCACDEAKYQVCFEQFFF